MTIIFRPIALSDLATYETLSNEANLGFTAISKDPAIIEKKLKKSLESFEKCVTSPQDEYYLFVAEDSKTKKVLGISGISAMTGESSPLFFFKQQFEEKTSDICDIVKKRKLLVPISYVRAPSELCSLFVSKSAREKGVGKLLSFARFLFIKAYPQRFTGSIFAILRGKVIHNSTSVFWKEVGSHFYKKSFKEVLCQLQFGRSFIADFLPEHPIYASLLSEKVQECLGKPDPHTIPAYNMLKKLGFKDTDEIDVLDAGPRLSANACDITIIQQSVQTQVSSITDSIEDTSLKLIANQKIAFRALFASADIHNGGCTITKEIAEALQVGVGDHLLIYKGNA